MLINGIKIVLFLPFCHSFLFSWRPRGRDVSWRYFQQLQRKMRIVDLKIWLFQEGWHPERILRWNETVPNLAHAFCSKIWKHNNWLYICFFLACLFFSQKLVLASWRPTSSWTNWGRYGVWEALPDTHSTHGFFNAKPLQCGAFREPTPPYLKDAASWPTTWSR